MPFKKISSPTADHREADSSGSTEKTFDNIRYDFLQGFFYASLTSILITLSGTAVKKVSYISPSQHSFVRSVCGFVGVLPVIVYYNIQILGDKEDIFTLVLRGFATATAQYTMFIAYRYLPLAEAAIIISTVPFLTTAMARIYLKEPCGLTQIICLVLISIGLVLSLRIPDLIFKRSDVNIDSSYLRGLAAAVANVFCISIATVAIRKVKHIHFSVTTIYSGFIGAIENGVINAAGDPFVAPYCGWDQMLCLAVGVLGFLGNCTYILSLQRQAVGLVVIEKAAVDIIVNIVLQIMFFSQYLDTYLCCGALLVMVSLAVTGIQNWLLIRPQNSNATL